VKAIQTNLKIAKDGLRFDRRGASLEFLEGRMLSGIGALNDHQS
jgi:hypothetical protein